MVMTPSMRTLLGLILLCLFFFISCSSNDDDPVSPGNQDPGEDDPIATGSDFLADHSVTALFDQIPAAAIEGVSSDLRIYYGHTSHGSQLMTGLSMLESENPSYQRPHVHEPGGDLGHNGSLTWEQSTRAFLADHADDYDVVVWSWCGGCSDNTDAGIDTYLSAMNQLEIDFPAVTFIYMTGHLDGSGPGGTLYASNDRIRDYCTDHDKVLFDFADIESYDPDGNYYPDGGDGCEWCVDWCADNDCEECSGCAHSHCFNCYQKGKAFWWLLAQIWIDDNVN